MPKMVPFSSTFFLALIAIQLCIATSYNVVDFGAKGDGMTDSTIAFLQAWKAACNSNTQSTMSVPSGTFLVKQTRFEGPCNNKIQVVIDGTIVAPNYQSFDDSSKSWIMFYKVSGLSVIGGTFSAKGSSLWNCKMGGKNNCPFGKTSVSFQTCSNVLVSGLKSQEPQRVHVSINDSNNVLVQNVQITAPDESPNTDGIHIGTSRGVRITRSTIATGDDCISIDEGSVNLQMDNILCGPGHGISIGSLGGNEAGVENMLVTDCVFQGTQNGVRIKTIPGASTAYVNKIIFQNLIMKNVSNPIIIDQNYCNGNDQRCLGESSGVKVSQVTYRNIRGTSFTQDAITFRCSSSYPCRGITLQNVALNYVDSLKKPTASYVANAQIITAGTVFPKLFDKKFIYNTD